MDHPEETDTVVPCLPLPPCRKQLPVRNWPRHTLFIILAFRDQLPVKNISTPLAWTWCHQYPINKKLIPSVPHWRLFHLYLLNAFDLHNFTICYSVRHRQHHAPFTVSSCRVWLPVNCQTNTWHVYTSLYLSTWWPPVPWCYLTCKKTDIIVPH